MRHNRPEETLKVALLTLEAYCLWLLFRLVGGILTSGDYFGALSFLALLQVVTLWLYGSLSQRLRQLEGLKMTAIGVNGLLSVAVPLLMGFSLWRSLGVVAFGLSVSLRQLQLFQSPNSALFVLHSKQKFRRVTVFILIACNWFKAIADVNALYISLLTFCIYDMAELYWLNVYRWRQKEFDHVDAKTDQVGFGQDLGSLEVFNRPYALLSGFGAFILASIALAATKLPFVSAVVEALKQVVLLLVGYLAQWFYVAIDLEGKMGLVRNSANKDSALQDPSQYKAEEGLTQFNPSYEGISLLLIGLAMVAISIWVYKVLKQRGRAVDRATESIENKGSTALLKLERAVVKKKRRLRSEEEVLVELRQHYRQLLIRLKERGIVLEAGETADQIRQKLSLIYPEQWDLIELITEGYCAQRYGKGPQNLDEILLAFDMLKEEKR